LDFLPFIRKGGNKKKSSKSSESCLTTGRHKQFSRRSQGYSGEVGSSILYELPISNLKLGNQVFPWGGGAYFRLLPSPLFKMGVRSILKKHGAYLFYLHPWEIDPEQPKVNEAPKFLKFRHYVNLDKTESKLSYLIEGFKKCHFVTCHEYLDILGES